MFASAVAYATDVLEARLALCGLDMHGDDLIDRQMSNVSSTCETVKHTIGQHVL